MKWKDVFCFCQVIEVQGRHEIVSLVGTLAGEGHLHASLSDHHGCVIGGHVMGNMIVFTTAEVVIGNCDICLLYTSPSPRDA